MHTSPLSIQALFISMATSSFVLSPYNLYDAWYDNKVRNTISKFHTNLSHRKYAANGAMCAVDLE